MSHASLENSLSIGNDDSFVDSHKSRIAKQFSRAASTYNSAANVQLNIAQDAMNYLPDSVQTILDIGCGTGRNSQALAKKCSQLIGLDLAFGMLSFAKQYNTHLPVDTLWLQGDADHLPLQNDSVETVFSSMVLQWCNQPEHVLSEIYRVMKPGAKGVLAIMCEGSFVELNQSWLQLDNIQHVNNFASAQVWLQAAKSNGLHAELAVKKHVTWHQDIRQLLTSIKAIGANVVLPSHGLSANSGSANNHSTKSQQRLNRHSLQNLDTVYREKYAENLQLPLTYQVCYLQVCKSE